MTFEEAFDSYMLVSGRERSAAYHDTLKFQFFRSTFGRNFPIADITPKLISRCLAVLRGKTIKRGGQQVPLTPATINRHIQFLQRVWNHAHDLNEPVQHIRWKAFILVEAEARIYPLTEEEEKYVLENISESIRPLFMFSLLTGVRLRNAIGLRWSMINEDTQEISFRGKSRRPGGKTYIVPLTTQVRELLSSLKGHHPEFVFTHTAPRNTKHGHRKGERYPLTDHITRYYWEALDLGKRWHDVRHTFGTRLYRVSRDLHLVQRAMNHSDIHTTQRYVHMDHEDIRDAMESLPFINMNKPSVIEHNADTIKGPLEDPPNVINLQSYQHGAQERTRTSTTKDHWHLKNIGKPKPTRPFDK
jgi:integrase